MLILTPIGVILYLIIRPKKNLFEQYNEEVEGNLGVLENIITQRIEDYAEREQIFCPECTHCVEPKYKLCPNCNTVLKKECIHCHEDIRTTWKLCPYCMKDQKILLKKKKKK